MYVVEFPINPDYFLYKIKRLVINLQNKNKIFTKLKICHKLSIQNEWINFPMSTYILFTQKYFLLSEYSWKKNESWFQAVTQGGLAA